MGEPGAHETTAATVGCQLSPTLRLVYSNMRRDGFVGRSADFGSSLGKDVVGGTRRRARRAAAGRAVRLHGEIGRRRSRARLQGGGLGSCGRAFAFVRASRRDEAIDCGNLPARAGFLEGVKLRLHLLDQVVLLRSFQLAQEFFYQTG